MRNPKTPEQRAAEALQIAQQLETTGLPFDDPRVAELRRRLRDFADDGVSYSGALRMPELKLVLLVKLSCQRHITSEARITKL